MYSGRLFQMRGPATEKTRVPTVDSLTGGIWRRFEPAERTARWPGRSATRVSGPSNVAPVHSEPCKPGPPFYAQYVPGRSQCNMIPERRRCGLSGEVDRSVVQCRHTPGAIHITMKLMATCKGKDKGVPCPKVSLGLRRGAHLLYVGLEPVCG